MWPRYTLVVVVVPFLLFQAAQLKTVGMAEPASDNCFGDSTRQGKCVMYYLCNDTAAADENYTTEGMVYNSELRTHAQKVCTLYKKAMRQVEAYYGGARHVVRYHQVILRNRFDMNACVSDPKDQRLLYRVGKHELFSTTHPVPIAKFPRSIGIAGGVAYKRVVLPPDWVLDYWHPLEKAQYPQYFERRECRKEEYIQKWEKGELR